MSLKLVTTPPREKPALRGLAEAVSYRIPRAVTQVCLHTGGDSYPICPRCDSSLDREYIGFCDRCGQRLEWGIFPLAQIRHAGKQP